MKGKIRGLHLPTRARRPSLRLRVPLRLTTTNGRSVDTAAALYGGFEVEDPHLVLPLACASRLFDDVQAIAVRQEMASVAGNIELLALTERVKARVVAPGREGPDVCFRVLVTTGDTEVLVSDGGIDALGIRIESFAPGRWRFADEPRIRDTEAPQDW
jgi:hypothetical protein